MSLNDFKLNEIISLFGLCKKNKVDFYINASNCILPLLIKDVSEDSLILKSQLNLSLLKRELDGLGGVCMSFIIANYKYQWITKKIKINDFIVEIDIPQVLNKIALRSESRKYLDNDFFCNIDFNGNNVKVKVIEISPSGFSALIDVDYIHISPDDNVNCIFNINGNDFVTSGICKRLNYNFASEKNIISIKTEYNLTNLLDAVDLS